MHPQLQPLGVMRDSLHTFLVATIVLSAKVYSRVDLGVENATLSAMTGVRRLIQDGLVAQSSKL